MEKLLLGSPVASYLDKKSLIIFNKYEKDNKKKPTLAAITVGQDPSSMLYVRRKQEKAKELNANFYWKKLDQDSTLEDVKDIIDELKTLEGLILQLPVPSHLDKDKLIDFIPPNIDVDGLHTNNLGSMFNDKQQVIPATARAIIEIFNYYKIDFTGKDVAILGRSRLVTAPLALLLSTQKYSATVTVLHSKSMNIYDTIKRSDIVVCAIGKPFFLNQSHFKKDSIVIDVGISKKDNKSYGDIDPTNTKEILYARSPYPGGVGPVTVSALYSNLSELIS